MHVMHVRWCRCLSVAADRAFVRGHWTDVARSVERATSRFGL